MARLPRLGRGARSDGEPSRAEETPTHAEYSFDETGLPTEGVIAPASDAAAAGEWPPAGDDAAAVEAPSLDAGVVEAPSLDAAVALASRPGSGGSWREVVPPRFRRPALAAALVVLSLGYTQFVVHGAQASHHRGTPLALMFQFTIQGLLGGLAAVGFVLIYRTQKFLSFIASSVGLVGGVMAINLILLTPTPFFLAIIGGVLVGAASGALFELCFVRRFFDAPRLTLTVVTIAAIGALVTSATGWVIKLPFFPRFETIAPEDLTRPISDKLPFAGFHFSIGGLALRFGFGHLFALELVIVALGGMGFFFRFTRSGTAVRALSENPERAELLGISTRKLSTLVWTIAGALSAIDIIASGAVSQGGASNFQNTDLLLIPLAAAVLAGMDSLPMTMLWATLLTVLQGATLYSYPDKQGVTDFAVFAAVGVALLLQRRRRTRSEAHSEGGWQASDEVRPIPKELSGVPSVRNGRWVAIGICLLAVVIVPFLASTGLTSQLSYIALLSIVAVSLVVLMGWAGQVSLGQFGFVAIGAVLCGSFTTDVGIPFWLAVPLATAITAAVAFVVGLPALRIRGLFLAAITFAFAVAVHSFLFDPHYFQWLLPANVNRPTLFFIDFADERSMYFLCIVGLIATVVVVGNLRRSRFGRTLIAMRENEAGLQSMGISVVRTKLTAFAVSGAIAGFAGALIAVQQRGVSAPSFTSQASLQIFVFAVLGGITSVTGVLLGQATLQLMTYLGGNNQFVAIILQWLPLGVLYAMPSGFIGILVALRDAWLRIVAQRRQLIVPSLFADYDPEVLARRLVPLAPGGAAIGVGVSPGGKFELQSRLTEHSESLGSASREELALAGARKAAAEVETFEGAPV